MPDPRLQSLNRVMPPRLRQYQQNRRRFAVKAYAIAFVFILISVGQWFPFYLINVIRNFFKSQFYIPIIFLSVALIFTFIFIFSEAARFRLPINWIIGIIILECVTLGLLNVFLGGTGLMLLVVSTTLSLVVTTLFVLFGIIIPHDLTLDVVVIFLVALIFFLASLFFVMLHLMMHLKSVVFIFGLLVFIPTALFTMYHAQTINGNRYGEMRVTDFILAGLIIYHDFVIFLLVIFLVMHSIFCRYVYKTTQDKAYCNP